MGYDLNFWRYSDERVPVRSPADHLGVYAELCEAGAHPQLQPLDVGAVRERLSTVLDAAWTMRDGDMATDGPVSWVPRSDRSAVIEALLTAQWIRFDLRGDWTGDDANTLIDVMHEFGTPLFDPQVGEHGTRYQLAF